MTKDKLLVHTLPVGPLQTNCYLAVCSETKACAIVDPGGDAGTILTAVKHDQLEVKHVLLTHAHFDHMAAVAEVVAAIQAPLAIHPEDVPLLQMGGGGMMWGFNPFSTRQVRVVLTNTARS